MTCVDKTELPQECLSLILSLTSPSGVVRSSAVSKQLLLASTSDLVWEKFLPSDCDEIISQSSTPHLQQFMSKKDLFLHLCRSPLLFNSNTQPWWWHACKGSSTGDAREKREKSVALDTRSGKKSYFLGARALEIEWGDTTQYWIWKSMPESRFPEVAVLLDVCWLDIVGKLRTRLLSPKTTYGAYFVFKMDADNCWGFDNTPVKVCVSKIDEIGSSENQQHTAVEKLFKLKAPEGRRRSRKAKDLPVERDDGWMEIEMGKYKVDIHAPDHEVGVVLEMTLKEIEQLHRKSGLIVLGIELRPLD